MGLGQGVTVCFNPCPRVGGDAAIERTVRELNRFQSTLPRGERLGEVGDEVELELVSIHAPARGATIPRKAFAVGGPSFNPRSREGSDTPHVSS